MIALSDPYLDAKGEVERKEGEKAIKKIQGIQDWEQQRRESEARQEAALVGYETRYRRIQSGIQRKRGTLKTQAMKAKEEGRDVEAGVKYGASVAVAAGGGFFEGLTAPLRPYNIAKGLRNTREVLSTPEGRKQVVEEFKSDVAGGLATGAGAVLGGKVAGEVIGRIRGKPQTKARAQYEVEEQLPFEEELGQRYPQPVETYRPEYRGVEPVKDAGVVVDDGFMSSKLLPKGKWPTGKKAYIRTGGDLVPVQVAKDTRLMPVYKPIIDLERGVTYTPGIRDLLAPIESYKSYSGFSVIGLTGLPNIQERNVQEITRTREIAETKLRPVEVAKTTTKYRQDTTPIYTTIPVSKVKPTPIQKPRVKEITTSVLATPNVQKTTPIQEVQITTPSIPSMPIIRQTFSSSSVLSVRPVRRNKRTKTKKRKKRGIGELRKDPLKSISEVLKI